MQKLVLFSIVLFLGSIAAQAQQDTENRYSLFHATPKDQMRDFSIDRPDVTESPITVDGGHFQFEGDIIKWTKEGGTGGAELLTYMSGLYKIGLSHTWDIHIGIEAYNVLKDSEGNTLDKGYGATAVRLKHNFWGNDGDNKTAFGMIPYVLFPSGNIFDRQKVIYGIGFPFSYTLSETLGLGAQPQVDFIPDEETGDYDMSYFQTIVLGGPVIGNLDFYVEGLAIFFKGNANYLANGGLIYNVSDNVKIDIATNIGLNKEAPTRAYLGLSFRI